MMGAMYSLMVAEDWESGNVRVFYNGRGYKGKEVRKLLYGGNNSFEKKLGVICIGNRKGEYRSYLVLP